MTSKFKLSFRGKIFACFVLCCACVVLLRQNLDALYISLLEPGEVTWEINSLREWAFFVGGLLIFVLGAFVFYKLTARIIKKESQRRVQEQNLIYASIAHDLNPPMTSVQGFAKALMDLTALLRGIIAENYTDFEEHGIELDIDLPDQPVPVNADKIELKRALTNLVVNVYKHNPKGIKASIALRQKQSNAIIRIADSGTAGRSMLKRTMENIQKRLLSSFRLPK